MMQAISQLPHPLQALLATLFTWGITAAGAAMVFCCKNIRHDVLDGLLGTSAGVMLAAAFWSLLSPAIEMAQKMGRVPWLPALIGLSLGALGLYAADRLLLRLERRGDTPYHTKKRTTLLIASITLHNIPEGLAVGVAFGSLLYGLDGATLAAACMLALGIGIQNFPEGAAISLPLLRDGASKRRAFMAGMLSGAVEPIARGNWRAAGAARARGAALYVGLCRGRDDLCGGGGADSREPSQRQAGQNCAVYAGGICADDGAGCGAFNIEKPGAA